MRAPAAATGSAGVDYASRALDFHRSPAIPMLLDIRETVRNSKPIKYTLIGLICVPFALVGIGSYFAGGSVQPVAKVDGRPIDAQALDRAYRQQRQRFAQVFGGRIPAALDDEALLRRQALEQLVNERVLADEVADMRFAVGDDTLGRAIRERPEFQTDGRFDKDRYTQLVTGAGGVAAFEAQYRDETAMDQFRSGVVATGFTLPAEAARVDALARQTRTIDALRFDLDTAKAAVRISDGDVAARFEKGAADYMFPPRVRVAYIELSADTIADTLDVSEGDAQAWYEANKARFVTPATREASHILFAVDDPGKADAVAAKVAEAKEVRARIEAGESFEDLAKALSADTGSAASGGSLGAISPGLMVAPFEEAVDALQTEGELSEPVVTEFGVHLIRLDRIVPESGRSFDEMRDEAFAGAKRDAADAEFGELREALTEAAFDQPESLEAASTATGLPVQESGWLDADTDSGPVLSNPAVQTAAFSDDVRQDGNNSEPVEIGERHVVVLRTIEDEGERPKALEDVRDQVAEALRAERAEASLDRQAADSAVALAGGADPVALAREPAPGANDGDAAAGEAADTAASGTADAVASGTAAGAPDDAANGVATAISGEVLTRDATGFDPATVAQLFAASAPAPGAPSTGTSTLADGDRLAWRITAVERSDVASGAAAGTPAAEAAPGAAPGDAPSATAGGPPATPSGADPRLGGVEFSALLESLRDRADVELSPVTTGEDG